MTNFDLGIILAVLFVALGITLAIERRRASGRDDPPGHDAGALAVGTFVPASHSAGCDAGSSSGGDCSASS